MEDIRQFVTQKVTQILGNIYDTHINGVQRQPMPVQYTTGCRNRRSFRTILYKFQS